MRTINRYITKLLVGGALVGLAACGENIPTAVQPSTSTPGAAATITAALPNATGSAAPSNRATVTATEAVASAPPATEPARSDRQYAALPQSKTPEGYYVLGQPDAPITLTYYSDFL